MSTSLSPFVPGARVALMGVTGGIFNVTTSVDRVDATYGTVFICGFSDGFEPFRVNGGWKARQINPGAKNTPNLVMWDDEIESRYRKRVRLCAAINFLPPDALTDEMLEKLGKVLS